MSQKHPLWVEISRFSFLAPSQICFFLTFDIRNPEISGFRFTKIDLSQPPGGVGSSYLESLEPFIRVLRIFDEKNFWWFFHEKFPIWKFWNSILGEFWHEQSQWAIDFRLAWSSRGSVHVQKTQIYWRFPNVLPRIGNRIIYWSAADPEQIRRRSAAK